MIKLAPAVLFGLFTWVLARERAIPGIAGVCVFLFGFFLATTGFGHAVGDLLTGWMTGTGGGHPTPVAPVVPTHPGVIGA